MRKFVVLIAGVLAAAIGIVAVAQAGGTSTDTIRTISGAVSTGKGTAKGNKPAALNFTLGTTKTVKPDGTACTPFAGDCVLPNIAVHDDITLPSGFKFNGGILKGNKKGKVTGATAFPVCKGADTNPKNGIPDIVEGASGPGKACKTIGGGKDKATGYLHTCGDLSTPNSQAAVGQKVSADIAVYNGGGKANGNGGTLYGRLVVKTVQGGTTIAFGAINVSFTKNKIAFEVPDNLVEPLANVCAPLTNTILNLDKKTATVKRKIGGKVRSVPRGLIESGSCPKSKTWAFSNTVHLSTGAQDLNTLKVIRDINNAAVTTATGNTTARCTR
jgi:hypothetical protein